VGYRAFIAEVIDDELNRFYNKGNSAAVLGDSSFKKTLARNKKT